MERGKSHNGLTHLSRLQVDYGWHYRQMCLFFTEFQILRKEEFGGNKMYSEYEELHNDFAKEVGLNYSSIFDLPVST